MPLLPLPIQTHNCCKHVGVNIFSFHVLGALRNLGFWNDPWVVLVCILWIIILLLLVCCFHCKHTKETLYFWCKLWATTKEEFALNVVTLHLQHHQLYTHAHVLKATKVFNNLCKTHGTINKMLVLVPHRVSREDKITCKVVGFWHLHGFDVLVLWHWHYWHWN